VNDLWPTYDVESFPNCFLVSAELLGSDQCSTWEISDFRDDRRSLLEWLYWLKENETISIGFNSVAYDYQMVHYFMMHPNATAAEMYAENQRIFAARQVNKFASIPHWKRVIPQLDLFLVHHFDNKAKTSSLKALEVNMRSRRVLESSIPFGTVLTERQINEVIIPYNVWDVKETKRFAFYSKGAIEFRIGMIEEFSIDVLNYNDTKIGKKMLEKRLGEDICYTRDANGRKQKRQTIRRTIPLKDIIFPYIFFENPEFQRILDFKKAQVLRPEDLENPEATIKTKGAYKIHAHVGGLDFHFGTGGVHASVDRKVFREGAGYGIHDIDVEGLYPRVAIVNLLAPEHLGERFIVEYAKIPEERKQHAKGTYKNGALKLAANGAWGESNNEHSVFYDPKYAMTIPINGQLMITMLAERLVNVPTLSLIQANTDGITYMVHDDYVPMCREIEKVWQDYTMLKLEYAQYQSMFIRDVNNYIAVKKAKPGSNNPEIKLKGAYWTPDPLNYAESISNASPPCWYKDLSNIVSVRAAVAAMVWGTDPEHFIRCHTDPFDFMIRIKVDRKSQLTLGNEVIQSTSRYYVAKNGAPMVKISPPPEGHHIGQYRRKPKVTLAEYNAVMAQTGGAWDERVCTGKPDKPNSWGTYDMRRTAIEAGWNVAECNDADNFRFDNVNYDYYVAEAKKLIIS